MNHAVITCGVNEKNDSEFFTYPRDFDIKRAISLKQQANNINALFSI
jgi:hypothetical protein